MDKKLEDTYRILSLIEDGEAVTQRRLSSGLGYSLGKVNYLLKGLIERGLIKLNNIRSREDKTYYIYLLPPRGIREKIKLTKEYLKKREAEYYIMRNEISSLKKKISDN